MRQSAKIATLVSVLVIAGLLAIPACTPPVASKSPEVVAENFMKACQEGDDLQARTFSVVHTVPHVEEWKPISTTKAAHETGLLSSFRDGFVKQRELAAKLRKLHNEKGDYPGKKFQMKQYRDEIVQLREEFPALYDVQATGRIAPLFGGWRFDDLKGFYTLDIAHYDVTATLWVFDSTEKQDGRFRVRLAYMKTDRGGDSGWRVFDIVDAEGRTILVRSEAGEAATQPAGDIPRLLDETKALDEEG